jgi:hypothetical protein
MKKRNIIFGVILIVITLTTILLACRKQDSTQTAVNPANNKQSGLQNRSSGTQTYYSTDNDGHFFKLDLIWGINGALQIDRTVVTSYPDGTEHICMLEEGIDYDDTGDTLFVGTPSGLTYYHIPFSPGADLGAVSGGGSTKYYCQKQCNDNTTTCAMEVISGSGGTSASCSGSCNRCALIGSKCPSTLGWDPLITNPGSILVEATSVNVIH